MLKHEGDHRHEYFHTQFVPLELPKLILNKISNTEIASEIMDLHAQQHDITFEIDIMSWRAQTAIPVKYDAFGWFEDTSKERLLEISFRGRFVVDGHADGTYHRLIYRQLPATYSIDGLIPALRAAFEYLENPTPEAGEGAPISDLMRGFVNVHTDNRIPPMISALKTMGYDSAVAKALAHKVVVENIDVHDHDRLMEIALDLTPGRSR